MESKEKGLEQEPPPPYTGAYGYYPMQGQTYGYPPQQVAGQPPVYCPQQPQYGQAPDQSQYGQPPPGYQPANVYGQPQMQFGQPGQQSQQMINQSGPYPHVIIVSPGPIPNPPPDHLIFNIIMTLFCCWPIGICAIMKSLECRNAIQIGDRESAESHSNAAKRLGMWTLGIGMITLLVFMLLAVLMAVI